MRYQRHIQNQALHHYKEVAKVATEFLDHNQYDNLILVGQHHEIKNLQDHLPKRVNTKVIDLSSLDSYGMKENINNILEKVIEDLRKNETKKEVDQVQKIVNASPQVSATGWQDTIRLIEEGRADTVIIPGYKTYIGWKCNGCLYITKEQHQAGCAACDNGFRKTDLTEEVIRLVFKKGGKVELVKGEAAEELEQYEGIGVLVRY